MSNLRKCANGHEYNADQYSACPFCNKSKAQIVFGGAGKTVAPGMTPPVMPGVDRPVTPVAKPEGLSKTVPADGGVEPPKEPAKKQDVGKTVWESKKKNKYDPVVGWLVCVEGPEKGKSYILHSGVNFVGRDDSNDISFPYEAISRRNHMKIAYDPKYISYRLIPGESHDIVYHNDEGLYEACSLEAYDRIELGELKLVFVPFCGEKFQWAK